VFVKINIIRFLCLVAVLRVLSRSTGRSFHSRSGGAQQFLCSCPSSVFHSRFHWVLRA